MTTPELLQLDPTPGRPGTRVWVAHTTPTAYAYGLTADDARRHYIARYLLGVTPGNRPAALPELAYDRVTLPADSAGTEAADTFVAGWLAALYTFYRGPHPTERTTP